MVLRGFAGGLLEFPELDGGLSGIEKFGRHIPSFEEGPGAVGQEQGSGGVKYYGIALWAAFQPGENSSYDRRIGVAVSAGEVA